jgi:hypothetical protein
MSGYMDVFDRHGEIRRTVEKIPSGVRSTTGSNDPRIAARLQEHVGSMYDHVGHGHPTLFSDPAGP